MKELYSFANQHVSVKCIWQNRRQPKESYVPIEREPPTPLRDLLKSLYTFDTNITKLFNEGEPDRIKTLIGKIDIALYGNKTTPKFMNANDLKAVTQPYLADIHTGFRYFEALDHPGDISHVQDWQEVRKNIEVLSDFMHMAQSYENILRPTSAFPSPPAVTEPIANIPNTKEIDAAFAKEEEEE